MEIIIDIAVFCFGAIIGSFLNVLALRYNTSISLMGRSFCFSCRKELSWRDMIPLASFFVLHGKCRFCGTKISWQYFLAELLTGAVFLFSFLKLGGVSAFYFTDENFKLFFGEILYVWAVFGLLIVIALYDIRHKIIPDALSYSFAAITFGKLAFEYVFFTGVIPPNAIDFLAGPILALPLALLWLVSRGRWIGLGDAKLALGIGWFLGLSSGTNALILSFWIGAVFGIILLTISSNKQFFIFGKHITMKTEVPFAPFLMFGLFLAFLGHEPIVLLSGFSELLFTGL